MSKKITYKEAYQRFTNQGRTDIKLCAEGYTGFNNKAKFWDTNEQDYFWAIPYNVFKQKSSHPRVAIKKRIEIQKFSFEDAKQKFTNQGRTDISLCEDGYNGWTKKSKFFDTIEEDFFEAVPSSVFTIKSVHPKRADKNRAQIKTISFEEAKLRFIKQGRTDIKLLKDGYTGFTKKLNF